MSLYTLFCRHCHSDVARGTAEVIPDLAYINQSTYQNFEAFVLQGLYSPNGMPNFSEFFTAKEVSDIRNYILSFAHQAANSEHGL